MSFPPGTGLDVRAGSPRVTGLAPSHTPGLAAACPACGTPRRPGTRFCGRCGRDGGPPAAPPLPAAARVSALPAAPTRLTARLRTTRVERGAAPRLACVVEADNDGAAAWRWLAVTAFLLSADGIPLADYGYAREVHIPPGERWGWEIVFALPTDDTGFTADSRLAQVVVQIVACDVARRELAELPLTHPYPTRALRVPALPPGLRAVGGQLVLRPSVWGGQDGPAALDACLLLRNLTAHRLPWVRLTLQASEGEGAARALTASLRGDRALEGGEVGLLVARGFPAATGADRRAWRAILEMAFPVAEGLLHEAVMIDVPQDVPLPVVDPPRRVCTGDGGWEVRLLGEPVVRRARSRERPSLLVLVLGLEPGTSVREALATAWFGERAWHCPLPPGADFGAAWWPATSAGDNGRVSYEQLHARGDTATFLEQVFPYLDSVFLVDARAKRIDELSLFESSLRFAMTFDVLAKSRQHGLELIEFILD